MAFFQYLIINDTALPLPDSYEVKLEDREADSGGETEAGTMQRDVIRMGVASIQVTFSVTAKWLKLLTQMKQMEKLEVLYFSPEDAEMKAAQMYITGFQAKLVKDTSYRSLWTVSFMLQEF